MNIVTRQFVSKFARVGKEVNAMNIASKEAQLYRLRDLLWFACNWALKKLPPRSCGSSCGILST